MEVSQICARRAPPWHLGERPGQLRARPPMHTDLPGKPEPAFQSAESELPVQDRPISGACAVLGPTTPRGARRNLGVRFRLVRAVGHTAGPPVMYQSCILGRTVLAPPGWPCALPRRRKVLRPDRDLAAEARSPPARLRLDRCVSHTQCECDHEGSAPLTN